MTTSARPLPMVVGRTENALRALLMRSLEGTQLAGYEEWVALNLVDGRTEGGVDVLDSVCRQLGLDRGRAALLLDALVARGLVTCERTSYAVSRDGSTLLATLRPAVAGVSRRVVEGLLVEDLDVAIRVLDRLRVEAERELTAGGTPSSATARS